MILDRQAMKIK